MNENFKNWRTTITGFIVAIIPIIVVFNLLTPEQGQELVIQITDIILPAVQAIIGAVGAIVLMFKAKD